MDFQSLHEPVSNRRRKINEPDKKCDFPQEFPTPTQTFPAVVGFSGRRGRNSGCEAEGALEV